MKVDQIIQNLQLVNTELEKRKPVLEDLGLLTGGVEYKLDNELAACKATLKIQKAPKLSIVQKIEQAKSIILKTDVRTDDFTLIKNRVIGLGYSSSEQKEKLNALRGLLTHIAGKNETHFKEYLSQPNNSYQNYNTAKAWLMRFRETDLLNEITYCLHLLSEREHVILETYRKELNRESSTTQLYSGFMDSPSHVASELIRRATEEKWTKDTEFMKALMDIQGKSQRLDNDKKKVLKESKEKLTEINPDTIDFRVIAPVIERIRNVIRQVSASYPEFQRGIPRFKHIKHLLRYEEEIDTLLNILNSIPGAEPKMNELSSRYGLKPKEKLHPRKNWKDFQTFLHKVDKKSFEKEFVDRYEDPEVYHLFYNTKKQFHEWPKKWGEVIFGVLKGMLETSKVSTAVINARNQTWMAIDQQEKKLYKEIDDLRKELVSVLQKKLSHLTKESTEAFEKLEKSIKDELDSLSEPAKKAYRAAMKVVYKFHEQRLERWSKIFEELNGQTERAKFMMSTYSEKFDHIMRQFDDPHAVGSEIIERDKESLGYLNELEQEFAWLERLTAADFPKIDVDQHMKAVLPRLNAVYNLQNYKEIVRRKLIIMNTPDSIKALQLLYTHGYQAIKQFEYLQSALTIVGIAKLKENGPERVAA